jgi:hypothetical protein
MKKLAYLFGLMMVLSIGFTSCEKDGDDDPIVNPPKNTEWYGIWVETEVNGSTIDVADVAYEFKNGVAYKYYDYSVDPTVRDETFKLWDVHDNTLYLTKSNDEILPYSIVSNPNGNTFEIKKGLNTVTYEKQ